MRAAMRASGAGIDGFHLAVYSLGGRIAWNYAAARPERVNG